jgi:PAS domain S-box-containing protein
LKGNDHSLFAGQRFNDLITQAPLAVSFLKGYDLIIEFANPGMLNAWGKQDDVIGKPLALALPELLTNQPYIQLLQNVFTSGQAYHGYEAKVPYTHNGQDMFRYFDFVYTPFVDAYKTITGIIVVATDVTKQVEARQLLEDAEERLRLAIEATGIGNWDLDLKNNKIITSPRLAEIFGLDADGNITQQQLRNMIHGDDKEIVIKAFEAALQTGVYLYEARIVWADGSIHWIRTAGKVIFNNQHKPLRMLGTINDITERRQEDIMKNDFIAMASHELKTPLTSLKGYIQLILLKSRKSGDSFLINALAKCEKQINNMTRLINGFLNLSKIESGKLQLNAQRFDINVLINEVITDSLPATTGHNMVFTTGDPISIIADKEKIAQVLSNFINNAVKYSANNSEIIITAAIQGENLRVSVKDHGIGLKLKDQQNIFQRFYRVEDESTKGLSGFGIGLYLAAEIIKLHHGKIAVDSEEGKGAEFYFLLSVPAALTGSE